MVPSLYSIRAIARMLDREEFQVACTVIDENAELEHEKIEQQKVIDKEERAERLVKDVLNKII